MRMIRGCKTPMKAEGSQKLFKLKSFEFKLQPELHMQKPTVVSVHHERGHKGGTVLILLHLLPIYFRDKPSSVMSIWGEMRICWQLTYIVVH